jgi:hypothetical protein
MTTVSTVQFTSEFGSLAVEQIFKPGKENNEAREKVCIYANAIGIFFFFFFAMRPSFYEVLSCHPQILTMLNFLGVR